MESDELKRMKNRVEGLKTERTKYEDCWRDIDSFIVPGCTAFPERFEEHGELGDSQILNDSPTIAHRVLASGMQAGLTSPSRPWFKLTVPDMQLAEFQPVKLWLSFVEDLLYEIFAKSNFYNSTHAFYGQLSGPGTGAFNIDENFSTVINCRSYDAGSYWINNNKDGRVDVFVRCMKLTVRQIVEKFGLEKCSGDVSKAYDNGDYDSFRTVWNCIMPNGSRDPYSPGTNGKRFSSLWWEDGDSTADFLGRFGYEDFPVMVARWDLGDGCVYGRSPAWTALSDCKMLMQLEQSNLLGVDRMVDPPLIVPSAAKDKLDLLPGGISYFDESQNTGNVIRSVYDGLNVPLQYIDAKVNTVVERIKATMFNDLFMMISMASNPQMTAREITERHEEKLIMLGPVIERTKYEFLDPLIDRTFNIALRKGLLPDAPEELRGVPLKVDYISILAQAQRMTGLSAMNELLGMTANLVKLGSMDAMDKIDSDQFVDEAGRMLGVPPSIVRSDEDVAQLRQQKAQAMQAQQAQAAMQQAPDAAKKMADTPIGNGSALDALFNMAGGGGSL